MDLPFRLKSRKQLILQPSDPEKTNESAFFPLDKIVKCPVGNKLLAYFRTTFVSYSSSLARSEYE